MPVLLYLLRFYGIRRSLNRHRNMRLGIEAQHSFSFASKSQFYRVYDLKTIIGKNSAVNRLRESIGQANRVLLNMRSDYKSKVLALDIQIYFQTSPSALEVLVFKGRKQISVKRNMAMSRQFLTTFRKLYER